MYRCTTSNRHISAFWKSPTWEFLLAFILSEMTYILGMVLLMAVRAGSLKNYTWSAAGYIANVYSNFYLSKAWLYLLT